MIQANSKSAKIARALLQKVTIRNNSADHASYLKLADSLRTKGLYNEAISEYARLGPDCKQIVGSPYAKKLSRFGLCIVTSNYMKLILGRLPRMHATVKLQERFLARLFKQLRK